MNSEGMEGIESFLVVRLDLSNQNERISHQDACESDQTKDRVKPKWLTEQQKDRYHANQSQGRREDRHSKC